MPINASAQESLLKILQEVFAEPCEEEQGFEPGPDPSEVGSVLRVPDALLTAAGLTAPRSVCVLLRDDDGVLVVPICRHPQEVGAGEVLIPEEESPFSHRVTLSAWCPLRLPPRALSLLRPIARIPTAGQAGLVARSLTPPRARLHEWRAWQRLITRLGGSSGGREPQRPPQPDSSAAQSH